MNKEKLKKILFRIVAVISIGFVVGCLLLVALMAYFAYLEDDVKYMKTRGYAITLGVANIDSHDAFRLGYGKPLSSERVYFEETDTVRVTETYPGFLLHCVESEREMQGKTTPRLHICDIEVLDARFRFGKKKIGIGSTREEIERAYAKDRDIDVRYLGEEHGNFDADAGYSIGDFGRHILFFYDDKDCVERMIIIARIW